VEKRKGRIGGHLFITKLVNVKSVIAVIEQCLPESN
jgi:hypothetical protein